MCPFITHVGTPYCLFTALLHTRELTTPEQISVGRNARLGPATDRNALQPFHYPLGQLSHPIRVIHHCDSTTQARNRTLPAPSIQPSLPPSQHRKFLSAQLKNSASAAQSSASAACRLSSASCFSFSAYSSARWRACSTVSPACALAWCTDPATDSAVSLAACRQNSIQWRDLSRCFGIFRTMQVRGMYLQSRQFWAFVPTPLCP